MFSFGKKRKKLSKANYPEGSYIEEAGQGALGDDDQIAGPDVLVGSSFLDDPVGTGSYPEPARPARSSSFILTGRNALILSLLGLVIAAWAFFVGLFMGLGFLLEDKAFNKMQTILTGKSDLQAGVGQDGSIVSEVEQGFMKFIGREKPVTPPPAPEPEPEPAPEPAPEPKPEPPPRPKGKYTIQVLATKIQGDAEKMAADLKNQGLDEAYSTDMEQATGFYRVRIGHYETLTAARAAMTKMKLDGHQFNGMFISKIDNN